MPANMMPRPYLPPGVVVMPDLIEESDFSMGWAPDGENPTTAFTKLLDTLNLLPDRNTGTMYARPGFNRLGDVLAEESARWILQLFHFRAGDQANHYLIAVTTDGTTNANNVKIYAYNIAANTSTRIDTAGVTWDNSTAHHWGVGIDNKWYGGSKGNAMYSWDMTTWDADAGTGNWRAVVDDVNAGVNTDTQYARDFAFRGHEVVTYSGKVYAPNKQIRYDKWEDSVGYRIGDLVSDQQAYGQSGSEKYWKSFQCIKGHKGAGAGAERPQTGADTDLYWKKVKLGLPVDDSGKTGPSWNFVPHAAETSVACWHADRLFMRYDDQGELSRVLYSAPVKYERQEDVPDTVWDPKSFAPGTDFNGAGGGWRAFNDGRHGGVIECLLSYGQYLLVFKRRTVWALSGTDDTTWNSRPIATDKGTMGPRGAVEMDGLVYFISDDGLYVTDGTSAEPVTGAENVQQYIRDRLDISQKLNDNRDPELVAFDGFLFITLMQSSHSTEKSVTLVYHPATASFWKTNLPMLATSIYRDLGVDKLAFAAPPDYGQGYALIYRYHDGSTTDDSGAGNQTAATAIAWRARLPWWAFGTIREERRIRKVWSLVRGASQNVSLISRRNYSDSAVTTTVRAVNTSNAVFIEGEWFKDSHAVNFEVSGTAAPAAVYSLAVDTQRRRPRYHTGGG